MPVDLPALCAAALRVLRGGLPGRAVHPGHTGLRGVRLQRVGALHPAARGRPQQPAPTWGHSYVRWADIPLSVLSSCVPRYRLVQPL